MVDLEKYMKRDVMSTRNSYFKEERSKKEKALDDLYYSLSKEEKEHFEFFCGDLQETPESINAICSLIDKHILYAEEPWVSCGAFIEVDKIQIGRIGVYLRERFLEKNSKFSNYSNKIYNSILTTRIERVFSYQISIRLGTNFNRISFSKYFFRFMRTTRIFDECEIDDDFKYVFKWGKSIFTVYIGEPPIVLTRLGEMPKSRGDYCKIEMKYYKPDDIGAVTKTTKTILES